MASLPPDRFATPTGWILTALRRGPAGAAALADAIRAHGRRLGPGTLVASLARLERAELIERLASGEHPMYRLASHSEGRTAWIEG